MSNNLIYKDDTKPKSVKEAIEAGWKTAEEIYAAVSSSRTWDRFIVDVKKATSQKPNFGSATDDEANLVVKLGSAHKAYYHPKVEEAFQKWLERNQASMGRTSQLVKQATTNSVENNEYKYTKEDICNACGVSVSSFEHFAPQSIPERNFIVLGSSHKRLYNEEVLQQFQLWLMKNQANQGKSSEVVKQNTTNNLELGALVNVALTSREAWNQLKALGDARLDAEERLQLEQAKTQQLEHALEYDQIIGWHKWSDLKKQWKNQFDMLRHKINYTDLFTRAGLVEDKDYKRKVMGLDNYPTVLVSPEAEDMLFDWLDSHN